MVSLRPLVFSVVGILGCADAPAPEVERLTVAADEDGVGVGSAFQALPEVPKQDPRVVALGRGLFHDARLSADNTVSCATCHDLARGGVDGREAARGIRGQVGPINTPTVYNASLNFTQFWNGRAATLEDQANGPPLAAGEMGSASWDEILAKLGADPALRAEFAAVYPDGLTEKNVRGAIAAFERTLLTPSAFDRHLKGDAAALSPAARRGLDLFQTYGCVSCHQGRGVGGNMFQRFGTFEDYFAGRTPTEADLGRFAVTKKEEDRHVFKVPSLRNVALTAPYFHDASAKTLPDAVRVMGRFQLGRALSDDDVNDLVAFLESLTGDALRPR